MYYTVTVYCYRIVVYDNQVAINSSIEIRVIFRNLINRYGKIEMSGVWFIVDSLWHLEISRSFFSHFNKLIISYY